MLICRGVILWIWELQVIPARYLEVIGHKKNLPQRPNLRTLSKDVGESEGRTWYVIM